jgi:hypothetical protein
MLRNQSHQRSVRFVTSREERKHDKIQARENKLKEVRRPGYKQDKIDSFFEDHPSILMSNEEL